MLSIRCSKSSLHTHIQVFIVSYFTFQSTNWALCSYRETLLRQFHPDRCWIFTKCNASVNSNFLWILPLLIRTLTRHTYPLKMHYWRIQGVPVTSKQDGLEAVQTEDFLQLQKSTFYLFRLKKKTHQTINMTWHLKKKDESLFCIWVLHCPHTANEHWLM